MFRIQQKDGFPLPFAWRLHPQHIPFPQADIPAVFLDKMPACGIFQKRPIGASCICIKQSLGGYFKFPMHPRYHRRRRGNVVPLYIPSPQNPVFMQGIQRNLLHLPFTIQDGEASVDLSYLIHIPFPRPSILVKIHFRSLQLQGLSQGCKPQGYFGGIHPHPG